MKAYTVSVDDEFETTVIFAETPGKAKVIALNYFEPFQYYFFTELRAKRFPEADKLYNNKDYMEWENKEDRMFLIQHGWYCSRECRKECRECAARMCCDYYKDVIDF